MAYTGLESFMTQLQNLGLYDPSTMDFSDISGLTGGSIGSALASVYDMPLAGQATGIYAPLSEQLLKSSSISSYSDILQSQQQNLQTQLLGAYSSPLARKASGGFAGTGAVDVYGKKVESEYGQGMTEGLTNIYGQMGQSQSALSDWIQDIIQNVQSLQA